MHYYVDAYNLLFRNTHSEESLQKQRERLIQSLNRQALALNLAMTLVFDAMYQEGPLSRGHYHSLEIIYTSQNQTADDYLISLVEQSSQPQTLSIVTSDRRLAFRIRSLGARTVSIEEFLHWISSRYKKLKNKNLLPSKTPLDQLQSLPSVPLPKLPTKTPRIQTQEDRDLLAFEKRLEKLEKETPRSPRKKKRGLLSPRKDQGKNKAQEKAMEHLSDFDRWLNIFEKRSKTEGETE